MDHHRLHSCDRDRDAATGNESIGREASRTGGSGKCVGCGYRQTRHSVRCLAVDGTAGTWMELDEGNLFALSPSLTRCYWYGARRGGAGDLVRQRLSLSQGDAAEHDRRSPRSGRRMGLTTLRQASRCVRLCPREVCPPQPKRRCNGSLARHTRTQRRRLRPRFKHLLLLCF